MSAEGLLDVAPEILGRCERLSHAIAVRMRAVQSLRDEEGAQRADAGRARQMAREMLEALRSEAIPYLVGSVEGGMRPRGEHAEAYWLIDPLDGEEEFATGGEDYAFSLSLMVKEETLLAIVALPGRDIIYEYAAWGGSWRRGPGDEVGRVTARPRGERIVAAVAGEQQGRSEQTARRLGADRVVRRPLSPGICAVADGEADLFVQRGGVPVWKAAAPAALAEGAGCAVLDGSGYRLSFGLEEGFEHPGVIVLSTVETAPEPERAAVDEPPVPGVGGILNSALAGREDADARRLHEELVEWIEPAGPVEEVLVEKLAHTYLRLRRSAEAERCCHRRAWPLETADPGRAGETPARPRSGEFDPQAFAEAARLFERHDRTLTKQMVQLLREIERVRRRRVEDEAAVPLAGSGASALPENGAEPPGEADPGDR